MAKSPKDHTQNLLGKWLEIEIKHTTVAETTKENFETKTLVLVKKSDVARIAGHPICDDESLLALSDGVNFRVCLPYDKLKELVLHG